MISMIPKMRFSSVALPLAICPALALCQAAYAQLPASTITKLYQQGQQVSGMGQINSPFFPSQAGAVGAPSFVGLSTNNTGQAFVACNIFAVPPLNQAVLTPSQALVPYLANGLIPPDAGGLGLPTPDHAVRNLLGLDSNNDGVPMFGVQVGDADFGNPTVPTSGVTFGKLSMIALAGGPVTAAGVAPGTTFLPFTASALGAADGNLFLIGALINEQGVTRKALLKIATDSSGIVQSQTIVAKQGGPVGAGPATWTDISIKQNAAAINNAGQVAFSGSTSAGVTGIYRDSVLVAFDGGPTADPLQTWSGLLGAPLDINASGIVAFRAPYGTGTWTEAADAGETYTTSQVTSEGTLATIQGTLSDSNDVDLYRIRINDFAAFSATTVPGPGFPGAPGDTVLYLFRNFSNLNGATRNALARSDSAAAGVVQSTLTAANIPFDTANGTGEYYLAISTPKSRPVTTTGNELWHETPMSIQVSGGKLYWSDSANGVIRRADATTGAIDNSYAASVPARPYNGQNLGTGEMLTPPFGVFNNGAQKYLVWQTAAFALNELHRADPDVAFNDQVLITGVVPVQVSQTTGIAVDSVNSRIYWSRADVSATNTGGRINVCNIDGSGSTILLPTSNASRPRHLAIDPVGGFLYWVNTAAQSIERGNVAGTMTVTTLATSANAGGIALDTAAGKVYWTIPSTGTIERSNLDGTSRETFKTGLSTNTRRFYQGSIAISGTSLYFADVVSNSILVMPTTTLNPTATTLVNVGPVIGDNAADTTAHQDNLASWTRDAAATPNSMPYQIRLTGVGAFNQQAMIVKDNATKVAAVGDSPASIAPSTFLTLGSLTSPIRISNSGLVAYRATWGTTTGIMLGSDVALNRASVVVNHGQGVGTVDAGANGFDMSDSGQYIVTNTTNSVFPFSAEFLACQLAFAEVPGPTGPTCDSIDFNNDTSLFDPQDIDAFLSVYSEGPCIPDTATCNDIDFNNDDSVFDPCDIDAFLLQFSEGPCTLCGV